MFKIYFKMLEDKFRYIISYFEENMPVAESELNYENPYQLIVAVILIDNQIRCFVQNTLEESSSAGWAAGSTYNSSIVRVEFEDAEKAKKIINDYIRDKISSN